MKEYADSFENTTLEETLAKLGDDGIAGLRHDDPELRDPHGDIEVGGEVQGVDPGGLLHDGERDAAQHRPARRIDTGEAGAVE